LSENEVQIGFRGSEAYRSMLQQAALDRKIKVQRLVRIAVDAFLSAAESERPLPIEKLAANQASFAPENKRDHEQLEAILNEGDEEMRLGIRSNLKAFTVQLRALAADKRKASRVKTSAGRRRAAGE
jgi:hypothetical protein